MLEYTLDEADKLLNTNLKSAQDQLERIEEDLEFLREGSTRQEVYPATILWPPKNGPSPPFPWDQMTSTEVSMARTHNYEVTSKRNAEIKKVQAKK